MNRRVLLSTALASGAWFALTGHSPYRQWDVYRKIRLIVVVSADETGSVELARAVAAVLAQNLPESRATMARARDINDLVRLIASKQLDVALMREDDAVAVLTGAGRFADNGKVPLRVLALLGAYVFVCRDDMPRSNGYQIAETLAERWYAIDGTLVAGALSPRPLPSTRIPLHPGAHDYYEDHPPG